MDENQPNSGQNNEITLGQFNQLISEVAELKKKMMAAELDFEAMQSEYKKKLAVIGGYLKTNNMDNHKTNDGIVYMRRSYSWKLPQGSDFTAFKDWLSSNGLAEQYLSVHSGKFNSLIAEEKERADKRGELLSIPGVGDPTFTEMAIYKQG